MNNSINQEKEFLEFNSKISENLKIKKEEKDTVLSEYKDNTLYIDDLNKSEYYNINNEEPLNYDYTFYSTKQIEEYDLLNYDYSSFK